MGLKTIEISTPLKMTNFKQKGEKSMEHNLTIINLIPVGKDNAISRKELSRLAIHFGLVSPTARDSDRCVRSLISDARKDAVVLVNTKTGGYFLPSKESEEDMHELGNYLETEEGRAISIFESIKYARWLYEDYKHERLERMVFDDGTRCNV